MFFSGAGYNRMEYDGGEESREGQDAMHERIQTLRSRMHEQERIVQEIHQYLHSKTARGRGLEQQALPNTVPNLRIPSPDAAFSLQNRSSSVSRYQSKEIYSYNTVGSGEFPRAASPRPERQMTTPLRATRSMSPPPSRTDVMPRAFDPYPVNPRADSEPVNHHVVSGQGRSWLHSNSGGAGRHRQGALTVGPGEDAVVQVQVSPPPVAQAPGSGGRSGKEGLNAAYEAATAAVRRYDHVMETYQQRETARASGGGGGEDAEWDEALRGAHERAEEAIRRYQTLLRASAEGPDALPAAPPELWPDDLQSRADTESAASRDAPLPAQDPAAAQAEAGERRGGRSRDAVGEQARQEELLRRRADDDHWHHRPGRGEDPSEAGRAETRAGAQWREDPAEREAEAERAAREEQQRRRAAEQRRRAAEEERVAEEGRRLAAERAALAAERAALAEERRQLHAERQRPRSPPPHQHPPSQPSPLAVVAPPDAGRAGLVQGGSRSWSEGRLAWTQAVPLGEAKGAGLYGEVEGIVGRCEGHGEEAECATCQRLARQRADILRLLHRYSPATSASASASASAAAPLHFPAPSSNPSTPPPPIPSSTPSTVSAAQPAAHASPPAPSLYQPMPGQPPGPPTPALLSPHSLISVAPSPPPPPPPPRPTQAPLSVPPPPPPPPSAHVERLPPAPPQNTPAKPTAPASLSSSDELPPPPASLSDDLPPPQGASPGSAEKWRSEGQERGSGRRKEFERAMEEHEEEEHVKDEAMHDRARLEAQDAIRATKAAALAKQMDEEHRRLDSLRRRGFSGFDPYALAPDPQDSQPE